MTNNHMLVLDLMYSDFAGHQYPSPATIAWTLRDGGRIVEVRPQAIKKLTAHEAQALSAGEFIRTVAGVDVLPHSQDGTGSASQLSSEEHAQNGSRPRRPSGVFLCCMAARDSALCASERPIPQ